MKKIIIALGFISAIIAIVLSVTPLSQIAFIPGVAALILGILAMYLAKKTGGSKKSIQLIFLLTIIALTVTTYKSVFNTVEVGNTEEFELKETESEEQAIEDLEEFELDESDLE